MLLSAGQGQLIAPSVWSARNNIVAAVDLTVIGVQAWTLVADSDVDGSGTFEAQAITVSSSNVAALVFSAADYVLTNTINAGSSDLSLDSSGATAFQLGSHTAAADCEISQTELNLLQTTGTLTLGGSATSSF